MKYTNDVKVKSTIISDQTERDNLEYTFWKHYVDNGHSLCNVVTPSGKWVADIPLPF